MFAVFFSLQDRVLVSCPFDCFVLLPSHRSDMHSIHTSTVGFHGIPVAGVSIVKDSKKSHKRLKKGTNYDNSLYPLFQTLIFGLCYCFLRLYIPTDNEGEWSNDKNRDSFCHPKEVTFPSFQKQWLLCYQKTD